MRSFFWYGLGIFTMLLLGAKDKSPNMQDYIKQQIIIGVHHLQDSVMNNLTCQHDTISQNRDTIIPLIKNQNIEVLELRRRHSQDSAIIAFYREVTTENPDLVRKRK